MISLWKTIFVCVSIFALAGSLAAQTTTTTAPGGTNGSQKFPVFNAAPCDFSDTFYEENGVLALDHSTAPLDQASAGRFGLFRQTGPPASKFNGGNKNWVNDSTCPVNDPTRTNVRILATTGAYKDDDGAPKVFFSLIAFILNQNFFSPKNFFSKQPNPPPNMFTATCPACNVRGFQEVDIVNQFEAYGAPSQKITLNGQTVLAPTPCGSNHDANVAANDCFPLGVNPSNGFQAVETPNIRQDWRISSNRNAIDGSSNGPATPFGYFCDDLLGAWIVTYFWYTQNAIGGISSAGQPITPTANCSKVLACISHIHGNNLDGTPILKTGDELHFIEGVAGTPASVFAGNTCMTDMDLPPKQAPCGQEGNLAPDGSDGGAVWLSCPTILDPRNGAIAVDAFPDVVFTASGSPLDPDIINNFNCLQTTGDFKGSTACP